MHVCTELVFTLALIGFKIKNSIWKGPTCSSSHGVPTVLFICPRDMHASTLRRVSAETHGHNKIRRYIIIMTYYAIYRVT